MTTNLDDVYLRLDTHAKHIEDIICLLNDQELAIKNLIQNQERDREALALLNAEVESYGNR